MDTFFLLTAQSESEKTSQREWEEREIMEAKEREKIYREQKMKERELCAGLLYMYML